MEEFPHLLHTQYTTLDAMINECHDELMKDIFEQLRSGSVPTRYEDEYNSKHCQCNRNTQLDDASGPRC